ncbi:hypothetical protein CDIK_3251 [Cucumispora dikerogammari]|nr:hypothetical protein CDIK_3251 [Cucumispora dikerogammari]
MTTIINPFINEFASEEQALLFIYKKEMLPLTQLCSACGNIMILVSIFTSQCGRLWESSTMPKNYPFLTNHFFGLIKIELNIQLRCLLFIIMDLDEAQIVTIKGIFKPTLIKFKNAFSLKIRDEYCDNIKKQRDQVTLYKLTKQLSVRVE